MLKELTSKQLELTVRQQEILQVLCRLHYQNGRKATFREILDELGKTAPNGIMCHFVALAKKGWLEKGSEHKSRDWKLLKAPPGWVLLPGGGIMPVARIPELIEQLERTIHETSE